MANTQYPTPGMKDGDLRFGGEIKTRYPTWGLGEEYALHPPTFYPYIKNKRIPNVTDPNNPTFVDIFKGRADEDVIKKAKIVLKYSLWTTTGILIFDFCIGTQPKNLTALMQRAGFWGVPIIGGGLAYITTVAAMASARGKSDRFNYVAGGYMFGAISGFCRRSGHFGFCVGTAAALFGAFYKDSVIFGYEMFPIVRPARHGNPFSHKTDYTMRSHTWSGHGDWVRSEKERAGHKTYLEETEIYDTDTMC